MVYPPISTCRGGPESGHVRNLILVLIVAATVALSLAAFYTRSIAAPQVTFVSLQGERVTTAGLRGRVALINFRATDCPICARELPEMLRTYDKFHGRGLEFIAVAMQYDPPNYVVSYAERNRLPYTVGLDPAGEIAKAFGDVKLTPTTFVIDKRGNIVFRVTGEPDFAGLHELLELKLAEPA